MTPNPRLSILPVWMWQVLGLAAIGLFFAAVGMCFVCIRSRRWRVFVLGAPLTVLCFLLTHLRRIADSVQNMDIITRFFQDFNYLVKFISV